MFVFGQVGRGGDFDAVGCVVLFVGVVYEFVEAVRVPAGDVGGGCVVAVGAGGWFVVGAVGGF